MEDPGESSLENDKETSWEGEDDKMPERVVNQVSDDMRPWRIKGHDLKQVPL